MGDVLESMAAVTAVVLAVWGVGRPLLRVLVGDSEGRLAQVLFSAALGLAAWSGMLALLARLTWWNAGSIGSLTLLAATWGLVESAELWIVLFRSVRGAAHFQLPGSIRSRVLAVGAVRRIGRGVARFVRVRPSAVPAAVVAAATFIGAMVPPTSPLPQARMLAEAHALAVRGTALSMRDVVAAPGAMTLLTYAWAGSLGGPGGIELLNWVAGLGLAAAAVLLAVPVLGTTHAVTAGALCVLTPAVVGRLGLPQQDLLPSVLLLLSVAAWWQGHVEFGGLRWHILSAVCGGAAIGPIWIVPAAAVVFLAGTQSSGALHTWIQRVSRKRALKVFPSWLTVCLLVASAGAAYALCANVGQVRSRGTGELLSGAGPLLLAAAPGAWLARRLRGLRLLATGMAVAMLVAGFLLPTAAALVLVVLLAIGATWAWLELIRFPPIERRLARGALICLTMVGAVTPVRQGISELPIVFSRECRAAYVSERLGCHRAALVAGELMRPGDMLLSEDSHPYWFRCAVVSAERLHSSLPAVADFSRSTGLSTLMRGAGCTHVLLVDEPRDHAARSSSWLATLADHELQTQPEGDLLPLVEYVFCASDGRRQRYRLMMIRRPSSRSEASAGSGREQYSLAGNAVF